MEGMAQEVEPSAGWAATCPTTTSASRSAFVVTRDAKTRAASVSPTAAATNGARMPHARPTSPPASEPTRQRTDRHHAQHDEPVGGRHSPEQCVGDGGLAQGADHDLVERTGDRGQELGDQDHGHVRGQPEDGETGGRDQCGKPGDGSPTDSGHDSLGREGPDDRPRGGNRDEETEHFRRHPERPGHEQDQQPPGRGAEDVDRRGDERHAAQQVVVPEVGPPPAMLRPTPATVPCSWPRSAAVGRSWGSRNAASPARAKAPALVKKATEAAAANRKAPKGGPTRCLRRHFAAAQPSLVPGRRLRQPQSSPGPLPAGSRRGAAG